MPPSSITSPAFRRLVQSLRKHKKTLTVVEQCCGGLIQTSIMAQPGASSVFVGGSVPYNTKKGRAFLLNETTTTTTTTDGDGGAGSGGDGLYESILESQKAFDRSTKDGYIDSKFDWTKRVATSFCEALDTDYAITEGGAAGPTFNPDGMETGFAVVSVAGKTTQTTTATTTNGGTDDAGEDPSVELLEQKLVLSPDNDREGNMRLFADSAAELLTEIIESEHGKLDDDEAGDGRVDDGSGNADETGEPILLDRSTHLRSDEAALDAMKDGARYVVVRKDEILFRSPTELGLLSHEGLILRYDVDKTTRTFLGRLSDGDRTPVFSIDVVDRSAEDEDFPFVNDATGENYGYANVRTHAPLLNPLENEIALHAMAYANWQRSTRFCPSTGSPLELVHGGTAMRNPATGELSWPRQDPSMIASVVSRCGSKLLLARSPRHPPKMHTVLAGFVEAGETFERAVAREVFEEVGIRIDPGSVEYVGSQPWPFPRSSMAAFTARADATVPLAIDETELVEAGWFDRDSVGAAAAVGGPVMEPAVAAKALETDPSLELLVPPRGVIARTLIDRWLLRQE